MTTAKTFCSSFAFLIFLPTSALPANPFTVVIDPGHGGYDTGAITKDGKETITEKSLTLLLARDLARELVIRGFQAVLTRNDDHHSNLTDRTALANRVRANVFISLHMNSSGDQLAQAQGIETYIRNDATDESSRRLADLENSVLKESQVSDDGKSSGVSLIMKDMILDANLEPSKELACAVQSRIKGSSKSRGVKQALFYVLLGADMPAVLIEAGFVNHPEDRDRILKPKSRQRLVNQIASAIEDYKLKKPTTRCQVL